MIQLILQALIVGMIAGLVGIMWIVVRHSFDDDTYSDDNREGGSLSSEPSDGKNPHEPSSHGSKIAA